MIYYLVVVVAYYGCCARGGGGGGSNTTTWCFYPCPDNMVSQKLVLASIILRAHCGLSGGTSHSLVIKMIAYPWIDFAPSNTKMKHSMGVWIGFWGFGERETFMYDGI